MVDVGGKQVTRREAVAECRVRVSPDLMRLLVAGGRGGSLRKGDALGVARIAGVLAAKRTSDLIPLCHPLALDRVRVEVSPLELDEESQVVVRCSVACEGRTGVEMEALTGAAVAALALYDMCKSADKNIVIADLRLLSKTGGKSDYPPTASSEPPSREE